MINKIIAAGWEDDLPNYLRKRVHPTNVIALTVAFVIGVPFTIITQLYFPALVFLPLSGCLICLGIILINHWGGIRYSRVLLSLVPISLGATYNALLSGPTDDPLPSLFLIELSFALIPFVVFDAKEKGFLLFTIALSTVIILTFPITRDWVQSSYDSTPLRSGWVASLATLLAILGEFGFVTGMLIISKEAEKEAEVSRAETDAQNVKLLAQQEENERKTHALEEAQAEEKKRQWASDGLAQLMDVIRQGGEHQEGIFDKVIAMTVNYLKANQGGLFVVDRDDDSSVRIRLTACYAYQRKKFINKSIESGEGLIGQAFLEQEPIHLTEIPKDYVRITSGLGQATPTSLLIVPLKVNEVVEGIIELASFRLLKDHEVELVKKLGETIASHIQTQRTTQETRRLLIQAQEQTEELRATEEEMRQNQEELQATQEEMNRRYRTLEDQASEQEQELLAQIASLEQSNHSPAQR